MLQYSMRKGRRFTGPPASKKPADAAAGAAHVRKFMIKLFDREDGMAADWPLIAETLLAVAFYALDQSPADPRVLPLLRRVHSGSYDRLTADPPESRPPSGGVHNRASEIADWKVQPDHGEGPG
jgi:hypothetical protein